MALELFSTAFIIFIAVKDPPVAAIVILLLPGVIEIPEPAVSEAAAGAPAVDPIITCPSVAKAVTTGTPVVPVVNTPLFAVARADITLDADA